MADDPARAAARATMSTRRAVAAGPARGLGLSLALVLALSGTACTRADDDIVPSGRGGSATTGGGSSAAAGSSSTTGGSPGDGGDGAAPTDAASVAAAPSGGCSASPGSVGTLGDQRMTLDLDGTERAYVRHVPPGYDGTSPVPVVLDLVGYSNQPALESAISGLPAAADANGFVALTPEALGRPEHWDTSVGGADVDFLGRVLDDAERALCIDRNRVFATGFSEGGFMASTLACSMADRIAAIAPVAGLRDIPGCQADRPVPVITFHGTQDMFMLYDGGIGPDMLGLPGPDGGPGTLGDALAGDDTLIPGSPDIAVPATVAAWARRNGCEAEPADAPVTDDVGLVEYSSCPGGADVQLYRVRDGGHTWPGSEGTANFESVTGKTTFSIDATALMWEFFTAHPLTPA